MIRYVHYQCSHFRPKLAKHTEMKRKLLEIFEADYFPSCHYCVGGLSDDSERVVPAEQATDEEIREWREKYTMRV